MPITVPPPPTQELLGKPNTRRNRVVIIRLGGWALILAGLLYPLLALDASGLGWVRGSAEEVMPQLNDSGALEQYVWLIFSFVPLLLAIGAFGAFEALRRKGDTASGLGIGLALLAALFLMVGLMRWPAVNWDLAYAWENVQPERQVEVAQAFEAINMYMGQFVGGLLAGVALNGFLIVVSLAVLRAGRLPQWLGYFGFVAAAFGMVGAFRDFSPVAQAFHTVGNTLLLIPLWMIAFGIALVRIKR